MASRFHSFSRPIVAFAKHSGRKSGRPVSPTSVSRPSPAPFQRAPQREMGALRSLLPLHSAVSSARLTSRLGVESARSLFQGTLCSSFPGV